MDSSKVLNPMERAEIRIIETTKPSKKLLFLIVSNIFMKFINFKLKKYQDLLVTL
jgi:hypothetical protein|tara:strand:+ start:634 stop:798 length:165 start_codon:yes stop_codon:yes gene_type:complete